MLFPGCYIDYKYLNAACVVLLIFKTTFRANIHDVIGSLSIYSSWGAWFAFLIVIEFHTGAKCLTALQTETPDLGTGQK